MNAVNAVRSAFSATAGLLVTLVYKYTAHSFIQQ